MTRERLGSLTAEAMKAGDKPRVATLRLVSAAMKEREIEARTKGAPMGDADEVAVLRRMAKQRQDSIAAYEAAGRPALAEAERAELAIVESFLPAQLGEEATADAVGAAIAETGASGPRDMGKVMAALKARHGATLDLGRANAAVRARLAA